jgi:hypothetical protein
MSCSRVTSWTRRVRMAIAEKWRNGELGTLKWKIRFSWRWVSYHHSIFSFRSVDDGQIWHVLSEDSRRNSLSTQQPRNFPDIFTIWIVKQKLALSAFSPTCTITRSKKRVTGSWSRTTTTRMMVTIRSSEAQSFKSDFGVMMLMRKLTSRGRSSLNCQLLLTVGVFRARLWNSRIYATPIPWINVPLLDG